MWTGCRSIHKSHMKTSLVVPSLPLSFIMIVSPVVLKNKKKKRNQEFGGSVSISGLAKGVCCSGYSNQGR